MDAMRNALLERGRKGKSVLREEAATRNRHRLTQRADARCAPGGLRAGRVRPRARRPSAR